MPKTAEADDALYVALLQVCEKSFFAFVESCDPDRFALLVQKAESDAALRHSAAAESAGRRTTRSRKRSSGDAPQEKASPASNWLTSSVAFDGTFSKGTLEVVLPERLARWLVASLLGISREVEAGEVELLDDQVFDGIGELVNMICGAWLTDQADSQAFTIASPAAARVPAGWSPLADVSDEDRGHRLCILDQPMRILVRSSPE